MANLFCTVIELGCKNICNYEQFFAATLFRPLPLSGASLKKDHSRYNRYQRALKTVSKYGAS